MSRNFNFSVGGFYHIYNRGTEKREVFLSQSDYDRFVNLLYICNGTRAVDLNNNRKISPGVLNLERGEQIVKICAYCIMPNHFHILINETKAGGISSYMQKLSTAYTMYFNKKYERTGSLFQGRFKAQLADNDNYLKYLISYIHLNPVKLIEPDWKIRGITNKNRVKTFLNNYRYSSFLDFLKNRRVENKILSVESLPEYFNSRKDFENNLEDWLSFRDLSNSKFQGSTLETKD